MMFSHPRPVAVRRCAGGSTIPDVWPILWLFGLFLAMIGFFFLRALLGALILALRSAGRKRTARLGRATPMALQLASAFPTGISVRAVDSPRGRIGLDVDGTLGELTLGGESNGSNLGGGTLGTRLTFACRPPARFRMVPATFDTKLEDLLCGEWHPFGDAAFDARFRFMGPHVAWICDVLDPPTRNVLHRLALLSQDHSGAETLRIDVGRSGVTIGCEPELEEVREWIEHGAALMRRVRAYEAPDIQWVPSPAAGAAPGHCPVCATELSGAQRRCADCRTPHHAECWDYLGGCAMFACRSDRSVSA